jgi:hypothetical protein
MGTADVARFTLVIRPDGQAILTCQDRLPDSILPELRAAIGEWKTGASPVLVIAECDVVQVVDLDLELDLVPAAL